MFRWFAGPRRWTVVEDPDDVGYHLVCDPLLAVMQAEEWFALERAALVRDDDGAR